MPSSPRWSTTSPRTWTSRNTSRSSRTARRCARSSWPRAASSRRAWTRPPTPSACSTRCRKRSSRSPRTAIKKGFKSTAEMIPEAMELIEKIQKGGESQGLKTGFYELDDITSGFQNGDLIVFAARPSMGKTALAPEHRRAHGRQGRKVGGLLLHRDVQPAGADAHDGHPGQGQHELDPHRQAPPDPQGVERPGAGRLRAAEGASCTSTTRPRCPSWR